MTKPPKSPLWAEINDLRQQTRFAEDAIPPNAFTAAQYAETYRVTLKGAFFQLDAMVRMGLLESGKANAGSHNRRTKFYWKSRRAK